MSWDFLVASIAVTATPGAGALLTLSAGLSHGTRAAIVAAVGCTLGVLPHLVVALSGAAMILAASTLAFEAVKLLGVAYLVYIGWQTWRQTGSLTLPSASSQRTTAEPPLRTIRNAVLVNLLNPKLSLFFFVFLPTFTDGKAANTVWQMAALGGVFMMVTLVIFIGYGLCAGWIRPHILGRPAVMRWINRGFALTFVGLAAMLALGPSQLPPSTT